RRRRLRLVPKEALLLGRRKEEVSVLDAGVVLDDPVTVGEKVLPACPVRLGEGFVLEGVGDGVAVALAVGEDGDVGELALKAGDALFDLLKEPGVQREMGADGLADLPTLLVKEGKIGPELLERGIER